jgi:hypothetical protein
MLCPRLFYPYVYAFHLLPYSFPSISRIDFASIYVIVNFHSGLAPYAGINADTASDLARKSEPLNRSRQPQEQVAQFGVNRRPRETRISKIQLHTRAEALP